MNIRRIRQLTLTVLACTLVTLAPAVFGQDVSSKITGTVISGATVTATEKSRGTVYPAQTNSAGIYYLAPLPIGDYVLKVLAPGFSSVERPSFSLAMDQTARIDITMPVGQASQTVQVSAAPPLLQTHQTFLGTVLDARANVTLPLATRNYNQLTRAAIAVSTTACMRGSHRTIGISCPTSPSTWAALRGRDAARRGT
jgi:hypothetical protein